MSAPLGRIAQRLALVGIVATVVARCGTSMGPILPVVPTSAPTTPVPPAAHLTVPGQLAIDGDVGGFSWDGFASDAPWLPGAAPVRVAPDILASVRFGPGVRTEAWQAWYAPISGSGVDDAAAVLQSRSDQEIDFPAPPPGTWSVQVNVTFPGRGRVTFIWTLHVPGGGAGNSVVGRPRLEHRGSPRWAHTTPARPRFQDAWPEADAGQDVRRETDRGGARDRARRTRSRSHGPRRRRRAAPAPSGEQQAVVVGVPSPQGRAMDVPHRATTVAAMSDQRQALRVRRRSRHPPNLLRYQAAGTGIDSGHGGVEHAPVTGSTRIAAT